MDLFNLKGKTALITGSSSGLGLVLSSGLASYGCRIILNGRNPDKLAAAVSQMKDHGFDVTGYVFDVVNSREVEEVMEKNKNEIGNIDILVNNAGIQKRAPLEDFMEKDWDQVIDINLKGPYIMAKVVIKDMIKRQAGKIINICSLQSELARPTIAPYAASKGGLKMLTRAMATEWAKYNVQVNAIGPGYFKSEMTKALYENKEFDEWLCKRTPTNRWGNPEELIGTAVFLASDASSFVNGQIIYVDGGITACI
jgi:gluconate 5-dehydrogenase